MPGVCVTSRLLSTAAAFETACPAQPVVRTTHHTPYTTRQAVRLLGTNMWGVVTTLPCQPHKKAPSSHQCLTTCDSDALEKLGPQKLTKPTTGPTCAHEHGVRPLTGPTNPAAVPPRDRASGSGPCLSTGGAKFVTQPQMNQLQRENSNQLWR